MTILDQWRRNEGLTQQQLGAELGVTALRAHRLCAGKGKPATDGELAGILRRSRGRVPLAALYPQTAAALNELGLLTEPA